MVLAVNEPCGVNSGLNDAGLLHMMLYRVSDILKMPIFFCYSAAFHSFSIKNHTEILPAQTAVYCNVITWNRI